MSSRLCFSAISKYYSLQIDSKHTQDYTKLLSVCKVEILQVTVNKIEVLSSFSLIRDSLLKKSVIGLMSDDFC